MKLHFKKLALLFFAVVFIVSVALIDAHHISNVTAGSNLNINHDISSNKLNEKIIELPRTYASNPSTWQHNGVSIDTQSPTTGSTLTLTANAGGDTQNLYYRFIWTHNGDCGDVNETNRSNSAIWTPTSPGEYTIYSDISDDNGNVVTKTITFNVTLPWQHNGVSIDNPSPTPGSPITLTANAGGDTQNLYYRFIWTHNGDCGDVNETNRSNSATWVPESPGDYTIYSDISDDNGNVVTKKITFNASSSWQHNGVSIDNTSPTTGSPITLTANASGYTKNLYYRFIWTHNGDCGDVNETNLSNSATWTPTSPGEYTIYSDISDDNGNVVTNKTTFNVTLPWQHNGVSIDNPSPTPGSPITLTANASGDTQNLNYRFIWVGNGTSGDVNETNTSNSAEWIPDSPGDYTIYSDISDGYKNVVTKTAKLKVSPLSSISLSSSPKRGIDVSQWQGDIDWTKVKNSGIEFAMIRCGYGKDGLSQTDKKFYQNVNNAKAAGMPIGVYHYSYATSVNDAIKEANLCLKIIKGYKYEYPIVFDFEDPSQKNLGKRLSTDICKTFLKTIKDAGYYPALYTNCYFLEDCMYKNEILSEYDLWLAHWQVSSPRYTCGMWQYSSTGSVNGISGDVDTDIAYVDYPSLIKSMHVNGY